MDHQDMDNDKGVSKMEGFIALVVTPLITASGGTVELSGKPELVQEEIDRWMAKYDPMAYGTFVKDDRMVDGVRYCTVKWYGAD